MSPAFQTAGGIANPAILALKSIDGYLFAGGGTTVAGNAVILRSSDGQTFSQTTVPGTANDIWDIIKQGSTYYAVGRSGTILTSPDILTAPAGPTWTQIISGNAGANTSSNLNAIAFLNGKFIAVGNQSRILTSPDGATNNWTSITTPLGGMAIFGVAYGNGTYVAVGGSNNQNSPVAYILTSPDASTWTQRNAWTNNTFRGVVFHNGMFTAVGVNGQISRSADGINWYSVGSGDIRTNITSISVLDGRYYATLSAGASNGAFESQSALLISSDGEEWVRVTQGTANGPNRVELFGNRLYTGNGGATIMRTQALTALAAPTVTILTPPAAATSVAQGSSLALAANSTGEGIVTYQWKIGGVDIPDATDPSYALGNVQPADAGSYTLTVTNAAGTVTSTPIVVTVNATPVAPAILSHPQSQTQNVGFSTSLMVEASGTAPLTYQWYKDGVLVTDGGNVSGATTSEIMFNTLTAANAGNYTVVVSNGTAPAATSLPAVLNVDSNPAYNFTNLAGSPGFIGTTDATGWGARFDNPSGVAVDSSGNVYVSSPNTHTIRKVTSGGVVTTVAGLNYTPAYLDATGTAARFNSPRGLALNTAGTMLYVADTNNGKIRKIELSTGIVTTWATGLNSPLGLVFDASGNAYVACWDQTIRKITADGLTVTIFAGAQYSLGSTNNTIGTNARFNNPMGIAIDGSGNLYVADSNNAMIRKVTSAGAVTTYAGTSGVYGSIDGPALSAATFGSPHGIAVDAIGNVIVTDNTAHTVRKISPNGIVTTIGGQAYQSGFMDGNGPNTRFSGPAGLTIDSAGNLYLAENYNQIVRRASVSASLNLPVIQYSPNSQSVNVGANVTLSVTASGVSALSYQWKKNGVDIGSATSSTYSLSNVQIADAGGYRVLVTSNEGSALSAEATLTVTVPPAITAQPVASSVVNAGGSINLSVTSSEAIATYQWRRNGFEIPGAIGSSLSISNAQRSNSGYYDVVINGGAGSIVSTATDVRVAPTSYPGELTFDPTFSASPLLTLSCRLFTAIPLPGGKWMVGGEFVRWDSTPRTFIARLNADYTLDTGFTPPQINGFVHALALAPDGSIYVGGEFTAVDGHVVPGLFRLNSSGALDLTWRAQDSPPNATVTALAVQADGKPLVARAGTFPDQTATTGTNVLRRLNADGTLDGTFSVNIVTNGNRLNAIIAESDGDIVFAGTFASVNAASRNGLARVDTTGAVLDTTFGGSAGANTQA